MTPRKGLVLDANILLRAVFGQRVRQILEDYEDQANFYAPDICFHDARKYIPDLSSRRRFDVDLALSLLDQVALIVQPVDKSLYEDYLALVSFRATLTIGRLRRLRSSSTFRFGPRIRTSLAAASQSGQRTVSSYFFENSEHPAKA